MEGSPNTHQWFRRPGDVPRPGRQTLAVLRTWPDRLTATLGTPMEQPQLRHDYKLQAATIQFSSYTTACISMATNVYSTYSTLFPMPTVAIRESSTSLASPKYYISTRCTKVFSLGDRLLKDMIRRPGSRTICFKQLWRSHVDGVIGLQVRAARRLEFNPHT